MVLTVDGITQLFHIITGFSWPLSLAFGAIVAPIDPVLANLIAVHDANDDSMRVSLSSEVGMNDGTALPVLMLATAVGMVVGDVLSFGDTVERLFAAAIVVALGISLADHWNPLGLVLAAILFVVIRSLSVWLATVGTRTPPLRRMLIGGLGIRDIGSVNYIAYAFSHGLAGKDAERMVNMALTLIVASVIVHGIIVTPLLN